jgi:hypothetical protein
MKRILLFSLAFEQQLYLHRVKLRPKMKTTATTTTSVNMDMGMDGQTKN